MSASSIDQAKVAERVWHDSWYQENARAEFPESPADFRELFRRVQLTAFCEGGWSYWGDARNELMRICGDVRGLKVLDYGCGSGQLGIYLAMLGAEVTGFDLSPRGVEIANWAAQKYGLTCSFKAMDAEELDYPDRCFDLVVGFGVLHHVVKYPRSAQHIARVLKPGGRAVFHETLWENPLINFVRRWTTADDDAGDAHLTESSIRQFGKLCAHAEIRKRHIFYMLKRLAKISDRDLSRPLRPRPFWRALRRIDKGLNRLGLSRFCGESIVVYTK